jgi:hypothetical protein
MSSKHKVVPTIHFSVGPDKAHAQTRYDRGVKITTHGPQSPLYAQADVKTAVDAVVADTTTLKGAMDAYATAFQSYLKARTALGTAVLAFDLSYGVLVTTAEKRCTSANDGTGLGLAPTGKTINPFLMPVAVVLTYSAKLNHIRIHVKRAKGSRSVSVETSTDPTNPALWKELDGDGAVHLIPNPAPGTYWVRAASKKATAKSDYTTPVSIIVR